MAGSEVYRLEIPIIIDDQSEAPLSQARERVNRFEQAAQKTNQRIRRMSTTDYRLRLSATDKARPTIDKVSRGLRSITSKAWNITLQVKDKVTGIIRNLIDKLTSPLTLLGAGTGLIAAVTFPLKLAGEFEQARMSFDFFMGSAEEGEKAFKDLVRFAKETPFEFPFLQDMMIQLMGAGYNFEQAKRALTAFGDAAGRTGAGMEGIASAMLGFTQIASTGKLTLQDLRQVALNLRIPLSMFAKELGIAESELGNVGEAGISSEKAMEAIIRTLEQRFAGGLKELSNSLFGLVSTIKDTARLTVTAFGTGMATPVRRILLDIVGLTDDTSGKFEEFQKTLETLGSRIGEKFEQIYKRIKQIFQDITDIPGFDEMTWSEKVTVALDHILKAIDTWVKGPGGESMEKLGRTLGELLEAGLRGILPNIGSLGWDIIKALAKGIWEGIVNHPVLNFIVSVLGGVKVGAMVGSVVPGVGNVVGGVAGGVSAAAAWWITKLLGDQAKEISQRKTGFTIEELLKGTAKGESPKQLQLYFGPPQPYYGPLPWENIQNYVPLPWETAPAEPQATKSRLGIKPYAEGGFTRPEGIYTRPHLALVAEAGPEAIIPLSARMRNRALNLWEETGRRLGIRSYAEGGFTRPVYAPAVTGVGSFGTVAVIAGPIKVTLNINASDGQDVLQTIRANYETIADEITDTIANGLEGAFHNMPKQK